MSNLDNIFELFSSNENLEGENPAVYIDFTSTPIYWIGMYKKVILNHETFNRKIVKLFKEASKDIDVNEVKNAGEYMVYTRAWNYIQNVDIYNDIHVKTINEYKDQDLILSLNLAVYFFEKYEQYEKCSHIKKILDIAKEDNLNLE
jgi:hypothetical protein